MIGKPSTSTLFVHLVFLNGELDEFVSSTADGSSSSDDKVSEDISFFFSRAVSYKLNGFCNQATVRRFWPFRLRGIVIQLVRQRKEKELLTKYGLI